MKPTEELAREWYLSIWPNPPEHYIKSHCASLTALLDRVREEEQARWSSSYGFSDPEEAWRHVNKVRGEEVEQARAEERKRCADIADEALKVCDHGIPYYAYGDNEAGVDLSNRLAEVADILRRIEEGKP